MPARTVRSLVVAGLGTLATILIGMALAAWLAGPDTVDNSEIVARTSPTLIDLVVALAAGAAGAYAASNPKVADSLPGVAIAISLVPPLCTVGILIALGDPAGAGGAMLLFTTNFVSIVLAASVVVASASGTATVQTAIHERPMVIVYRLSPLTYRLGKRFVKVDTFGMANLVAGRRIVPELIQQDFTPDAVAHETARYFEDGDYAARTRAALAEVRAKLGHGGASRRAAGQVLAVCDARRRGRG
jgi:hypothetical protein